MLSRPHRFHGYGSLRYVYRVGQTVRGAQCSLKYAQNDRRKSYRVAVVVSKKVHKSAVVRNRIRRRIYEVVRQNIVPDQPYDLVFTVFSDQVAEIPSDKLTQALLSQVRAAGLKTKKLS
jgi:ribonuclease P protein component